MVKAIIFDLDGTLYDRNAAYKKHCKKIIQKYCKYLNNKDVIIEELIALDNGGYADKNIVYQTIIDRWQIPVNKQVLIDEWITDASAFSTLEEGAESILEYLYNKYKLAVITNGSTLLQNCKIDSANLRHWFELILISEEAGLEKPEKEIFLIACDNLGIKPSEAVYIGDNYINDIEASTDTGLNAIWYNKFQNNNIHYSNTISNLSALKGIL